MPKFKIEVQELLQHIYEVEAPDATEAVASVIHDYQNGNIELTAEDLKETVVRQYGSFERWETKTDELVVTLA